MSRNVTEFTLALPEPAAVPITPGHLGHSHLDHAPGHLDQISHTSHAGRIGQTGRTGHTGCRPRQPAAGQLSNRQA